MNGHGHGKCASTTQRHQFHFILVVGLGGHFQNWRPANCFFAIVPRKRADPLHAPNASATAPHADGLGNFNTLGFENEVMGLRFLPVMVRS